MTRISKKKLIKVLKGDLEEPVTRESLLEQMARPMTQEQWLKGYHRWVQEHTLSSPLSEYESIENMGKKKRRRKNVND